MTMTQTQDTGHEPNPAGAPGGADTANGTNPADGANREAISVSAAVSAGKSGAATGKEIGFETGRLAHMANGAVVASIGKTRVLVTATASRGARPGADFFPLTVDMEERMYAVGKIPGSFFRREGRASDAATLTCRLTDRPLRPCFPKGFRNEVHVVGLVLSADQQNPYDVAAINAASAALSISGIPFNGPIGAVRLAYTTSGEWIPYPTYEEIEQASFEMVVAGRLLDDGDVAVMMVEASGTPEAGRMYDSGASPVDEAVLAEGLEQSKQWITEAVALQRRLIVSAGVKPPMDFVVHADYSDAVYDAVAAAVAADRLLELEQMRDRNERGVATDELVAEIMAELDLGALAAAGSGAGSAAGNADSAPATSTDTPAAAAPTPTTSAPDPQEIEGQVRAALRSLSKEAIRNRIISDNRRIDGRSTTDIRSLAAEVAVLPMAHGSGLFERGETQVINAATLGNERMDQLIDTIEPVERKRYMHHYNFPPFSTGEAGFMRGPKRREIGHGALAERALLPVVPAFEDFPYTLRVVSDVLSSNGSTSMASVCASSLSLMDAGVPILKPVAGIAMGLVAEGDNYITLTDILGSEDAFGDMDFKVAGTRDYVTALQLDTKIDGIPAQVLAEALEQARTARLAILDVMEATLAEPRDDVSENAPKIVTFEIPNDKVGEIIGPKGKVINMLQDETGTQIDVDDSDGVAKVTISATNRDKVYDAQERIDQIVNPPAPEVGKVYTGTVVNITGFGAFVNFLPGRDGLLHISKLGGKRRLERVEEVLSLGDEVLVTVEDDQADRISLNLVTDADAVADDAGDTRSDVDDADDADDFDGDARDFDDDFDGDTDDDAHDFDDSRGNSRGNSRGDFDDDDDAHGDARGNSRSDFDDDDGDGEDESGRREVSFGKEFDRQIEQDYGDLGPGELRRRGGGRGRR